MGNESLIKWFINKLKNIWFAGTFSAILLIIAHILKNELWGYIFAILLAYLFADIIKLIFIKGGEGIVQIPITGDTEIKHKGYGYLAFLISIIAGTILSGYISIAITTQITILMDFWKIVIPNAIIIVLVYIDYYLTFYKRR